MWKAASGCKRLQAVVPWYDKQIATEGVGIKKVGQEMAQVAYPVRVCCDRIADPMAHNMIKAMPVFHDDYKASAPGATGWAMSRQKLSKFVP